MIIRIYGMNVKIEADDGNKLKLVFGYNRRLVEDVKKMAGARYHQTKHPETGAVLERWWTIESSSRNLIAIKKMIGIDPYPEYNLPITPVMFVRAGMEHQREGLDFIITRRRGILAFDPGVGKSLIAIEAIEAMYNLGCRNPLWISTKNALASTRLELRKWGCKIMPQLIHYDAIPKMVKEWPSGKPIYDIVIADEISRCKNPSTKRYQAMEHICNSVRTEHKTHMILGMSGSPAPHDPTDWWALIELMAPGWLSEGSPSKLKSTLAVIRPTEAGDQRVFNKVITWKDDENKCAKCGLLPEQHDKAYMLMNNIPVEEFHNHIKSVNEVKRLADRLSPICLVRTKAVLKDLPAQIIRPYIVEPTKELRVAAELLTATSPTALQAMLLMRELSDGFQYEKTIDPVATCVCGGAESNPPCPHCHGSGVILRTDRKLHKFPTAKDDALQDLMDEFEDDRRLIVYAGFQASVDRVCDVVVKHGWDYARLDGRGIYTNWGAKSVDEAVQEFQENQERKVVWVGHPMAGGMGLTLTASRAIVYYSSDYNLESWLQSKDRNHRIGSKGSMLIPLFHLPVDKIVWDKHVSKQSLMRMSMGELKLLMEKESAENPGI